MSSPRAQRTLSRAIEFDGIGIHTGAPVHVRCVPAPIDSGLVFHRSDLPGTGPIPAQARYRVDRPRRTALADESGKAEVHTIEHMLSAAHAMGLDNMTVFMDGPEAPGLDGSALNFWEKFEGAGLVDQEAAVKPLILKQTLGLSHGGASVVAMPSAEAGLHLTYVLVYPVATLGAQVLELRLSPESFQKNIAPARTFCLEAEARALQAAGLGKGANTQNTVIYGEKGVIDTQLRFADEAVRHKMLDLIGDLALLGRPLQARVIAIKSGHELNAELVKLIQASE